MHNQNDVGNVIVHTNEESVISDIGRGRYTKAYFVRERYEHIANSSRRTLRSRAQRPGATPWRRTRRASAGAPRPAAHADLASFELRNAYPPEADLDSLQRTVVLQR